MKKNLPLILFFIFVCVIACPIVHKISNKILEHNQKDTVYTIINKTSRLSSNSSITIYKINNNKAINIVTGEEKEYLNENYDKGFIIVNDKNEIATQLESEDNCAIKDFSDQDVTFISKCNNLIIANDLFNIKDNTIKINNTNDIPSLVINTIESIKSDYLIYDSYNNIMPKENIKNNGTYKIVYTFKDTNNNDLFTKEYQLEYEKPTKNLSK